MHNERIDQTMGDEIVFDNDSHTFSTIRGESRKRLTNPGIQLDVSSKQVRTLLHRSANTRIYGHTSGRNSEGGPQMCISEYFSCPVTSAPEHRLGACFRALCFFPIRNVRWKRKIPIIYVLISSIITYVETVTY